MSCGVLPELNIDCRIFHISVIQTGDYDVKHDHMSRTPPGGEVTAGHVEQWRSAGSSAESSHYQEMVFSVMSTFIQEHRGQSASCAVAFRHVQYCHRVVILEDGTGHVLGGRRWGGVLPLFTSLFVLHHRIM